MRWGVKLEETAVPDPSTSRVELPHLDSTKEANETEDSGVDDELEIAEEEAVFSDPEDDEEMERIKPQSMEKEYQFKPIAKDEESIQNSNLSTEKDERESNEDITELEELENVGDDLKELLIQLSRERYLPRKLSKIAYLSYIFVALLLDW